MKLGNYMQDLAEARTIEEILELRALAESDPDLSDRAQQQIAAEATLRQLMLVGKGGQR